VAVANVVDSSSAQPIGPRYRLGDRLGAGASGQTFAATDTNTAEACVVKVFAADAGGRRVALAELRGLETLSHPNIVRLRDAGRLPDGRAYLVTDRIVGPGLEAIATIADEGERRAQFCRAAVDLVTALAQLHARGIVHGDVCPANVRLATDAGAPTRAVLLDFGLAGPPRPADGGARGTLGYAAPEALTGARTPAVDLHALGATLFETWSGTTPFGRGLAAAQRMLGGPAPALSSVRPGLGSGWDDLVARLLAAEQEKQQTEQAQSRRLQVGSGDRSERIRTYNFPQGRVTDHRINLTLYKLPQIMNGQLDELLDALHQEHQAELLAAEE